MGATKSTELRTADKPRKVYTDVFIINKHEQLILLGKRKGNFGHGIFDGYGGKPEANETIVETAIR